MSEENNDENVVSDIVENSNVIQSRNIALIGPLAAGKSTIAKYLEENYGYKVFPMARFLKKLAVEMLGRPINKETDRVFLQKLGNNLRTEWKNLSEEDKELYAEWLGNQAFRQFVSENSEELFTDTLWINLQQNDLEFQQYVAKGKAAVDDMRYCNEGGWWIDIIGGLVVFLDVPEEVVIERLKSRDNNFDPAWLEHESELQWMKIPAHIPIFNAEKATVENIVKSFERYLV
jgi:dephospho-CoA kinase